MYTPRIKGQTIEEVRSGVLVAHGPCVFSGDEHRTAEFSAKAFERWQAGAYVQHAFPALSADDREFLMSGIGPKAFPEDPEEE